MEDFYAAKGKKKAEGTIDLDSLFPKDKAYFNYDSSLATPTCSEVINWFVLKNPVNASEEQLDSFTNTLDSNYRPVMPINEREIMTFTE